MDAITYFTCQFKKSSWQTATQFLKEYCLTTYQILLPGLHPMMFCLEFL